MSGTPKLAKGQKYEFECCKCGSKELTRGATTISEPDGTLTWEASEVAIEFQCARKTCGAVSYLLVRSTEKGTSVTWRDFLSDRVRLGSLS